MPDFRPTQISDCHLARRLPKLTENFHRVSEYIDATRPDLVINSGDLAFDGPDHRDDLEFAKTLHDALPVACPAITTSATTRPMSARRRLSRSRKQASRRSSQSSVRTAGASRPPAGALSASIRRS
jgi:3',5'-cyclic AMP phosphodiesterase CpdA